MLGTALSVEEREEIRIGLEAGDPFAELARALGTWEAALEIACSGATPEHPVIIVLDEFPYLMKSEPAIEAILQNQWDRVLSRLPVLMLLVGSNVSMMHALSEYGRPLYGRHREMVVRPLPPAEIGTLLHLPAREALDAYLVIGGLPRLAEVWRDGERHWSFLGRELADPESPLVALGERAINRELPAETKRGTCSRRSGTARQASPPSRAAPA